MILTLAEALEECNMHQQFTLHAFIELLQQYVELIRFTLYSFDGIRMSSIRINNEIDVCLPSIIITDIDTKEGCTIVKNITDGTTTYNAFMD